MIGIYLVALTVAVIYAALSRAASYNTPADVPTRTIPGTTLPAETIAAGRRTGDHRA